MIVGPERRSESGSKSLVGKDDGKKRRTKVVTCSEKIVYTGAGQGVLFMRELN